MSEFFAMGGYAQYVWPSFFLTLVVMAANLLLAMRQRKKVVAHLRQQSAANATKSAQSTADLSNN